MKVVADTLLLKSCSKRVQQIRNYIHSVIFSIFRAYGRHARAENTEMRICSKLTLNTIAFQGSNVFVDSATRAFRNVKTTSTQRPRNKQPYNSRCYLTACKQLPLLSNGPTNTHSTMEGLLGCVLCAVRAETL
jgi:hypothetical protein